MLKQYHSPYVPFLGWQFFGLRFWDAKLLSCERRRLWPGASVLHGGYNTAILDVKENADLGRGGIETYPQARIFLRGMSPKGAAVARMEVQI
jgi:hypothetical protein